MYFYVLLLYFLIFLLNCDLNTQKKNTIAVTGAIPFNASQIHHKLPKKDTLPFTVWFSPTLIFCYLVCFDLLVVCVGAWRCLFLLLGCRELPEAQLLTRQSHPTENIWFVQFCDQRSFLYSFKKEM